MWRPVSIAAQLASSWARSSQAGALDNARVASVERSRAAVERADVLLHLDALGCPPGARSGHVTVVSR